MPDNIQRGYTFIELATLDILFGEKAEIAFEILK